MTDESHGWGASEAATPPAGATPAGWYPDPWSQGHHRYWDGAKWTGGYFPNGPANPASLEGTDTAEVPPSPAIPPPADRLPSPPPPPEWSAPTSYLTWTTPPGPDSWGTPATVEDGAPKPSWFSSGVGFVALVIGIMIVVGSLGTAGGYLAFRHRSSPTPTASGAPPGVVGPTNPTPTPTVPADPSARALESLVLAQSDVPSTVVVQTLDGGDQVNGQPTLDLCNGTFPSESLRSARLQVGAYDGAATLLLSTEAVLYANPAATEQAFSELKAVAAGCPATPVTSPVGEPTAVTHFNAAPDASWSTNPSVVRQAFDFVSTDDNGTAHHSVAVYLRRGRVLMGVYFSQPDSPQMTVAGQGTLEAIAAVFTARMAKLPPSVVNG